MNEQVSPPTQWEVTLAWEAAQAANSAYDVLRAERLNAETFHSGGYNEFSADDSAERAHNAALMDVAKRTGSYHNVDALYDDAKTTFDQLIDLAAPVMLRADSPFAVDAAGTIPAIVSEYDTSTARQLNALPVDYRNEVLARYGQKLTAVARYICAGLVSDRFANVYRPPFTSPPRLSAAIGRIVSLAATYEVMAINGLQPELVFVPKQLGPRQWENLIASHAGSRAIRPTASERTTDVKKWGVAVVSGREEPIQVNPNKRGKYGSADKRLVEALKQLPGMPNMPRRADPEEVIVQASPTQEVYSALLLAHLERGGGPLDVIGATIGRGYDDKGVAIPVAMDNIQDGSYPEVRVLPLVYSSPYRPTIGVRPSVEA